MCSWGQRKPYAARLWGSLIAASVPAMRIEAQIVKES